MVLSQKLIRYPDSGWNANVTVLKSIITVNNFDSEHSVKQQNIQHLMQANESLRMASLDP